MRRDVARIGSGIGNTNDFSRFSRRSCNAFTKRDVIQIHALIVTLAKTVRQNFPLRVNQHDAEGVECNQRVNRDRDLGEKLVQIQDRAEFLG